MKAPRGGQQTQGMKGPQDPQTTCERPARPSCLLCKGLKPLPLQLLLTCLFLLLGADRFLEDLRIQADGADARAACPAMHAGKMLLTPQTCPMASDCRLAFEPSSRVGHTALRRHAATQGHRIGHRVAFHQFDTLLLAECPDAPLAPASEWPIDHPTSVLGDANNGILAIPTDVRLALPVSHEHLLPSERD